MGRFRIATAMGSVLLIGVGFAALRDPSDWWVGALLAFLIALLLTACLGVVYRTGRQRALWLGILVFGGGYLVLSRFVFTEAAISPVALTNWGLDSLALNRRSGPRAEGEKVLAEMKQGEFVPASVVQIDHANHRYFVKYDGWTDYHNAWVVQAQLKVQNADAYHGAGNLLVALLVALAGSVVAVAFHDSHERRGSLAEH